jgi:hypothetical protein
MTTPAMRLVKAISSSGPTSSRQFMSQKSRDWCKTHHPGSPITEVGPGGKRAPRKKSVR